VIEHRNREDVTNQEPINQQPINNPVTLSDHHIVGTVVFFSDDYRSIVDGLKALREELAQFEGVKKKFDLDESPYDRLIERIDRIVERVEPKLQGVAKNRQMPIFEDGVTIGSLRLLKAGGLFIVSQMMVKRNDFLKRQQRVPRAIIASIDEKIAQLKDNLEQGVMNGLPPADIFIEIATELEILPARKPIEPPSDQPGTKSPSQSTVPPYLERIPIIDEELRIRCLHLLASLESADIHETNKADRLDTAVREMSVILEDRVRKVSGLEDKRLEGVKLMAAAFGGDDPVLCFSMEQGVQDGAHHLYRGYSGFVRNEVMHRLVKTYTVERVLQLLGHVDYLLSLLTQTKRKTPKSETVE
jgi:hypothetical protein